MSTEKENAPPPTTTRPRRASLAELFASRPTNLEPSATSTSQLRTQAPTMASAATHQAQAQAQAQQQQGPTTGRRLSITTLGLSGSASSSTPSASTAFRNARRGASISDKPRLDEIEGESAIADDEVMKTGVGSPIGRRMSFGARAAYRDRSSNGGSTSGSATAVSPPSANKEAGFNWSDNLKQRAQRSSISAATASSPQGMLGGGNISQNRSNSVATGKPTAAAAAAPARVPSAKPPPAKPDHFQERILRGDFYMD